MESGESTESQKVMWSPRSPGSLWSDRSEGVQEVWGVREVHRVRGVCGVTGAGESMES